MLLALLLFAGPLQAASLEAGKFDIELALSVGPP